MSTPGHTLRGTPHRDQGRGQGRGAIPFENSPASNIPRPRLGEQHQSSTNSEAATSANGFSTVSTSRQKQNKRDEVSYPSWKSQKSKSNVIALGYPQKDGGRS